MRIVLALITALILASPASAQALKVRETTGSVKDATDRLVKAIESKGLKVAARIDHAAGAKAAGMDMPPTEVVIFGNPKLGTALMLANPQIGVDLPLKIVIWQAVSGKDHDRLYCSRTRSRLASTSRTRTRCSQRWARRWKASQLLPPVLDQSVPRSRACLFADEQRAFSIPPHYASDVSGTAVPGLNAGSSSVVGWVKPPSLTRRENSPPMATSSLNFPRSITRP